MRCFQKEPVRMWIWMRQGAAVACSWTWQPMRRQYTRISLMTLKIFSMTTTCSDPPPALLRRPSTKTKKTAHDSFCLSFSLYRLLFSEIKPLRFCKKKTNEPFVLDQMSAKF